MNDICSSELWQYTQLRRHSRSKICKLFWIHLYHKLAKRKKCSTGVIESNVFFPLLHYILSCRDYMFHSWFLIERKECYSLCFWNMSILSVTYVMWFLLSKTFTEVYRFCFKHTATLIFFCNLLPPPTF